MAVRAAMRIAALLLATALTACGASGGPAADNGSEPNPDETAQAAPAPRPPAANAAEKTGQAPAGPALPIADTGAEGAAQIVRAYFSLAKQGRLAQARRLWHGDGADAESLGEALGRYRDFTATIEPPGRIEGAAGSLYTEVPYGIRGTLANGTVAEWHGTMTLRRVNDVPGSTPEQRRWHIERAELTPGG